MSEPQPLIAGRYRLVRVIATGGMGVVWEAWDERLERTVAIKQLHTAPGVPEAEAELAKTRAMREARITARLHHPHAVPVFDAVEHEGRPCLIMPFLPSTPLSTVLRERGPLPVADAARLGAQVASALSAAHRMGIVHRDVKPGNILLTADGAAHISDFGISHAMGDPTLTTTGMVHGTPAFLAPEVARGADATFASDVFSLGATLYAAIEGGPPFGTEPNSMALLHKVAAAQVEVPTRAGALTPFLLEMLSAEASKRPTMDAVAAHLSGFEAGPEPFEERTTAVIPPPVPAPAPSDDPSGEQAAEAPAPADRPTPAPARPAPARPVTRPPAHARPAAATGAAAATSKASVEPRKRVPARVLLVAVALVVVALVATALLTGRLGKDPGTAAEPDTVAASPEPSDAATSPQPTTPAPTTPAPTTPAPTEPPTTPPPTSAPPTQEPTQEPAPSQPAAEPAPDRAAQLTSAITDYYAVMPDDTDAAWPLMTADYQSGHAGGRESYEAFWDDIDDVTVSDVQAVPPDQAEATVTYYFDDGRVVVERTAYTLVDEDGVLKIAASTVLSSRGA